jgi:hypothetical protein
LEVSETLAERQLARQLDKTQQIAALTATVAVEEIFASVDVERRAGLPVQGTEADELGTMTCRSCDSVLLPQIIEQRKALFEFFETCRSLDFPRFGFRLIDPLARHQGAIAMLPK